MLPVLIESSQLWASILGVGIRGLNLKWKTRSREVASGEDHLLYKHEDTLVFINHKKNMNVFSNHECNNPWEVFAAL